MKHKLWFNMVRRKGRWIKMGWKLYTWNQTCPKTWPATWSWITGHHCAEASQSCKLIVGEMDLARHPLSAQVQNRGFDCNFCTHQELGGLKCQPPLSHLYKQPKGARRRGMTPSHWYEFSHICHRDGFTPTLITIGVIVLLLMHAPLLRKCRCICFGATWAACLTLVDGA
jgi:hypothetical protein